jgi:hypothetical protein
MSRKEFCVSKTKAPLPIKALPHLRWSPRPDGVSDDKIRTGSRLYAAGSLKSARLH